MQDLYGAFAENSEGADTAAAGLQPAGQILLGRARPVAAREMQKQRREKETGVGDGRRGNGRA